MEELKKLIEEMNKTFTEFRTENDRRIKEVEKLGRADPLTEAKIDKHSAAIGVLQKQIDEMTLKLQRPGVSPEDEGAVEVKRHRKLFVDGYVRKGQMPADLGELQVKLFQIGVDADGGFLVPVEMNRTIGKMELDATPMEGLVDIGTSSAETYESAMDLGETSSGWVGETTPRPETDTSKLGQFKPAYGEVYAFPFATQKMLDDSGINIEQWLASKVAEKFAKDVDIAILSGTGVNKPRGILNYTLVATGDATRAYGQIEKKHSGTSADFDSDDLIDIVHLLKPGYRLNGRWVMQGLTVAKVRKFKDTTNNYLWQPSLQLGQPSTLMGYGITEDENMPAIGAAANAIMFGDFRRAYKFFNVRGVRVLRDPLTVKGKVGFYTTKRIGGGVEDTSAIKVLHLAA